ncbi:MAG: SprB repeat-containing protein, partial [Bacteroidia bacterium]|nr:SprB repeat-containing protein [Bacteroidia bacterium]
MPEQNTPINLFSFNSNLWNAVLNKSFEGMEKMKKDFLFFILIVISGFFISENTFAQPCPPTSCSPPVTTVPITAPCGANVPTINLGVIPPAFSCVTPPLSRAGNCCTNSSPDRCLHFIFTIGASVAAVKLEFVCGAEPSGALYGQLSLNPVGAYPYSGCGTPFNVRDSLGCITAPGTWHLTFCKPGNNVNQYRITTIPKPTPLVDDSIRIGCRDTIFWLGIQNAGIVWRSLPTVGYPAADTTIYNSYLNFTTGHDTIVVTPLPGAPPYVDYAVSGFATAQECIGPQLFRDTVRVFFFPALQGTLPDTIGYCATQGGINLCANLVGGIPPYTYQWFNPVGSPIPLATNNCYFATAPGLYTVTINDYLSSPPKCGPARDSVQVVLDNIIITLNQTNVTCNGLCNGTITTTVTGGGSGYTFQWSDLALTQNRTGLCAGTYTVTVTSGGGACVGTASATITQPLSLSCIIDSLQNVGCNGEATGCIYSSCVGGTAPYTHQWSSGQTTSSICNLAAGVYTVTCTDANGCTCSTSVTITQPGVLVPLISSVNINGNNVSCYGFADDTSCANPVGGTPPYTYQWTPSGFSTQCVTGQGGGIVVCVTVTDANGCSADTCKIISQPDSLYLLVNSVSTCVGGWNLCCNGLTDGTIDIGTNGGTPPFIYDWSDILGNAPPNPSEGEDRAGIGAGTYTVTVTDLSGCTATISVTLSEPPALFDSLVSPVNAGGYNIGCRGECNGSISSNTVGGTPPYTYCWSSNVNPPNPD